MESLRVRVKICGITRLEDALLIARLGADAIGFIFAESPRRVTPETAKGIIDLLPPWVNCVGVFVNEEIDTVRSIQDYCSLDYLQFHGDEDPSYCRQFPRRSIKAFRLQTSQDLSSLGKYSVSAYLLDTFVKGQLGGTGKTFDWKLALLAKQYGPIILSGGLTQENVTQAIQLVHPYGVDASSGLEKSPGQKDQDKLSSFFRSLSSIEERGSWSSVSKE